MHPGAGNSRDGAASEVGTGVIRLTVRTLTAGESHTVRIGQSASVDALKASIEDVEGTAMALQRLAIMTSDGSATRQLSHGSALLSEYDLQDGSMLLLVKRHAPHSSSDGSMPDAAAVDAAAASGDFSPRSSIGSVQGQSGGGGSPDRLSVASSAASSNESRIPVHRGTPTRNGNSQRLSGTNAHDVSEEDIERKRGDADDNMSGGDDNEKEDPGEQTAGAKKKAAAAAQAERLRRLSEPVRPRGLELNELSTPEGEKKSTPAKKRLPGNKALVTGAATPKGPSTKSIAELKREKAEAEAAEEEARRKSEAWKRKRAREAAREAAAQAQASATGTGKDGSGGQGEGELGEAEAPRQQSNRRGGKSGSKGSNERKEQNKDDREQQRKGKRASKGKEGRRGKATGDDETTKRKPKTKQRRQGKAESGSGMESGSDLEELQPTASSKNVDTPERSRRAGESRRGAGGVVEADEISISLIDNDDSDSSSICSSPDRSRSDGRGGGSRSVDGGSSSSSSRSMQREKERGYLSSTSDSYSEDSDEDYIHTIRSPVLSASPTSGAGGGGGGGGGGGRVGSGRLSLVSPPPAVVQPRPILSSMSLGFPGGTGETTKGGVLFATARFGARVRVCTDHSHIYRQYASVS